MFLQIKTSWRESLGLFLATGFQKKTLSSKKGTTANYNCCHQFLYPDSFYHTLYSHSPEGRINNNQYMSVFASILRFVVVGLGFFLHIEWLEKKVIITKNNKQPYKTAHVSYTASSSSVFQKQKKRIGQCGSDSDLWLFRKSNSLMKLYVHEK